MKSRLVARLAAVLALIVFLLLHVTALRASEPAPAEQQDAFAAAVQAYRGGAYGEALVGFAALAQDEPDAARRGTLYANAGTAAARAERWGEAVWHLEAARRCVPDDVLTRRNLEQVRARVGLADDETSQFTDTLRRLPLALTETQTEHAVGGMAAFALLLLAGCRVGWLGRGMAWTALVLLAVAGGGWLASDVARAADLRRAVVLQGVAVRAEPDGSGRVLFRLGPGTVVSDEEERPGWRLVETTAGARGWAPAPAVRPAGS